MVIEVDMVIKKEDLEETESLDRAKIEKESITNESKHIKITLILLHNTSS